MKTTITRWLMLIILLCSSLVPAFGTDTVRREVRSPSGKLLSIMTTRGDTTEIREPSGKLVQRTKTKGDVTEVRSPSGKLLYKIKTH